MGGDFPSRAAAQLEVALNRSLSQFVGSQSYRDAEAYFESGAPDLDDPAFFEPFDRINERFAEWLDPGEVRPPPPEEVRREGDTLRFPSPAPIGQPAVDSVALKLFPSGRNPVRRTPVGRNPVGVLFHHWQGMSTWAAPGWLLRGLARHCRVAAMVAPHHLMRCADGFRSGEGFINPNPRAILDGFRQWLADHEASLQVLRRDLGFSRIVVVGYSLGAYGALLHRMIRPILPTVVINPTNCYARGVLEGDLTRALAQRVRQAGFTPESFARATRSLHLKRWASRISGEQLTWIYTRHDRVEPQDSLREARASLRPERLVEIGGGHATAVLRRRTLIAEIVRRLAPEAEDDRCFTDRRVESL